MESVIIEVYTEQSQPLSSDREYYRTLLSFSQVFLTATCHKSLIARKGKFEIVPYHNLTRRDVMLLTRAESRASSCGAETRPLARGKTNKNRKLPPNDHVLVRFDTSVANLRTVHKSKSRTPRLLQE